MKFQTHYNRIERRTFTFTKADIVNALKKETALWSGKLVNAIGEHWELEIDFDDDSGMPTATLTQTFEYKDVTPAAVDQQASSTGTPGHQ